MLAENNLALMIVEESQNCEEINKFSRFTFRKTKKNKLSENHKSFILPDSV